GALGEAITKNFGSQAEFEKQFAAAAMGQFGSGWAWLVAGKDKSLKIETTGNAETPIHTDSGTPLFTCDVWEHAYYIDYRNARAKYVEAFWKVLNWEFAGKNFEKA
ncbi:MAG: superoxide dismutase, partial [bacterium]